MMPVKPEFPEEIIEVVRRCAVQHGHLEFTRENTIELLNDAADDMMKSASMRLGNAHTAIMARIYHEGADFMILGEDGDLPENLMAGLSTLAPVRIKRSRTRRLQLN